MQQEGRRSARLTPQGAFVIQFYDNTDFAIGRVEGRVEHVLSGQACRFAALGALLAFIAHILCQAGSTPAEEVSLDL